MLTESNPWTFNGEPFESKDIDKWVGFVYLITNKLNGKRYIGRKYFHTIRKTRGKKRRVRKESDWQEYYSSSEDLKADVKKYGAKNFQREILSLHTTRGDCNYEEVKQQFLHNVLEEEGWYNQNIHNWKGKKSQRIVESRKYANK